MGESTVHFLLHEGTQAIILSKRVETDDDTVSEKKKGGVV